MVDIISFAKFEQNWNRGIGLSVDNTDHTFPYSNVSLFPHRISQWVVSMVNIRLFGSVVWVILFILVVVRLIYYYQSHWIVWKHFLTRQNYWEKFTSLLTHGRNEQVQENICSSPRCRDGFDICIFAF